MTGRVLARTATSERGAIGIVLLAGLAFVAVVVLALGRLGRGAVARARADTAADAAALAAAGRMVLASEADACTTAAETAAANSGRLTRCTIGANAVDVTVELVDGDLSARGHARAEIVDPARTDRPDRGGDER